MTDGEKKTISLNPNKTGKATISLGINISSEALNRAMQNIEKASASQKEIHLSKRLVSTVPGSDEVVTESASHLLSETVKSDPQSSKEKSVFEESFSKMQDTREKDANKKRKKPERVAPQQEVSQYVYNDDEVVPKKVFHKSRVASVVQPTDIKKEIVSEEIDTQEYEMLYGGSITVKSALPAIAKMAAKKQVRRRDVSTYQRVDVSKKSISVEEFVTLGTLAQEMGLRASALLKFLMDVGVVANINQSLDRDVIELLASEFGIEIRVKGDVVDEKIKQFMADIEDGDGETRPPVVAFMGHVDHGKTSLLDAIFSSDVASKESGGITQHIGARAIKTKSGQYISFLDTPGHAAFTEMRARGAKVTDIVVLVVAADDGVMVQTVEAINHIKNAGVEIVVAVNKMDKPGADIEKIKSELATNNVLVEEYGGNVMMVPVSATKKTNIDQLLDTILLQAEMMNLCAKKDGDAVGFVVESRSTKSHGPCAVVLVKSGTLRKGDVIMCGSTFGRVRTMLGANNRSVAEVEPSFPAEVFGLHSLPLAGDRFMVVSSEKEAERMIEKIKSKTKSHFSRPSLLGDLLTSTKNKKEINLIIKADTHGSLEAVGGLIEKIRHDQIKIEVVHSGVGPVTESDVAFAVVAGAKIIAFNVGVDPNARQKVRDAGVDVFSYDIIYNLEKEVRHMIAKMLDPKIKEEQVAVLDVRKVFPIKKVGTVVGCYVSSGVVKRGCMVKVFRNGVQIHQGKISSLKSFQDEVKEIGVGHECGILVDGLRDVVEGDVIKAFNVTRIEESL